MGEQYNRRHGDASYEQTGLYKRWCAMKARCTNSNDRNYKNYGGRGISLCNEWFDYVKFKTWAISNGFEEHLLLDRIDNDKGYCPENCRWTTRAVQNVNKRQRSKMLTVRGRTMEMRDWAKEVGHSGTGIIRQRVHAGWDDERAVLYPVSERGKAPKKNKLCY